MVAGEYRQEQALLDVSVGLAQAFVSGHLPREMKNIHWDPVFESGLTP